MEAFSLMGAHLDVMREGGGEKAQEGSKELDAHHGRGREWERYRGGFGDALGLFNQSEEVGCIG